MNNAYRRYIETGKAIAKVNSTSSLYEIFRLFLHRLVTGYGSDHYVTYSLFKKPLSFKGWREYVDKKDFCKMLFIHNKKSNFGVLEDKVVFAQQCVEKQLPHPGIHFTIGYPYQNTLFPNHCGKEVIVAFADIGDGDYIIKSCDGSYGINLWSVTKTGMGFFVHNDHSLISAAELAKKLEVSRECYLVQDKIKVAQNLHSIMPGRACGGFRINSFLNVDGSIAIRYVLAKLTAIGLVSDNFSGGSSGNMLATIDIDTQRICRVIRKFNDGLLHEITHHPDTGTDLRNYHFPNFDEVLALAQRCAQAFAQVPAVGWDIVLTDRGAVVLEGNPMFDPIGPQLCANRGVRNIIPKLME